MKKIGIHTFSWSLSELLESGLQPFNIVAGKDGRLYEIRHTEMGTIVVPAQNLRKLEDIPTGFQFNLPKIPGELLSQALSFFRDYCRNGTELEVMVSFWFNLYTGDYVVQCPFQHVSKGRIDYDGVELTEGFIEVLQLHSHNTMSAFFSDIDDRDEKRFLLYGVVGNLNEEVPSIKLRAGVNGHFYELSLDYIFDNPDLTKDADYPREWHNKVEVL